MSRTILQNILSCMLIRLDEPEIGELHQELLARFNLIGASNHCQALELLGTILTTGGKWRSLSRLGLEEKTGRRNLSQA